MFSVNKLLLIMGHIFAIILVKVQCAKRHNYPKNALIFEEEIFLKENEKNKYDF